MNDPIVKNTRVPRMLLLAAVLALAVGAVTYVTLNDAHQRIVETQAVATVEIVARHAVSARAAYTMEVAMKLVKDGTGGPHVAFEHNPGYVPLPAQFLKMVAREASGASQGMFRYRTLSKWNLEPAQGLEDDFQRWAWARLEAQDRANPTGPIDWVPAWRVERIDGVNVLRYLYADPAAVAACADCHNDFEQRPDIMERRQRAGLPPGRSFKRHQLLGALEVNIPLHRIEAIVVEESHRVLLLVTVATGIGAFLVAGFMGAGSRRRTTRRSWRELHDDITGLYNSHGFLQHADTLMRRSDRHGAVHAICSLHLEGLHVVRSATHKENVHRLLKQVANIIRKRLRAAAVIGRNEGEEFVIFLANHDAAEARSVAEALLRSIKKMRIRWKNQNFKIGARLGIAIVGNASVNAESALKVAQESRRAGVNEIEIRTL